MRIDSPTISGTFTITGGTIKDSIGNLILSSSVGSIVALSSNLYFPVQAPSQGSHIVGKNSSLILSSSATSVVAISGNLKTTGQVYPGVFTYNIISGSYTGSLDFSGGNTAILDLSCSIGGGTGLTASLVGLNVGGSYVVRVIQAFTGQTMLNVLFTSSLSKVYWPDGSAPTITATTRAVDIASFIYDGTYIYGSIIQNFS